MSDDNKPMKYARYAIGEIVLVVVGILIALQVNNWNEERIEQNKVKALLNGIHDDLKKDKERIAFLHEFYREKFSTMQLLVNFNSSENTLSNDSISAMFSRSLYFRRFSSKNSNYKSLINEGLLNSISDDKLIDELVSYYDSQYLTWSTEIYGEIITSINFQEAELYDARDRLNLDSALLNIPENQMTRFQNKTNYSELLESKWARDLLSSCLIQGNTIFANLESFDAMNANLQLAIKNYE